MAFSKFIIIR